MVGNDAVDPLQQAQTLGILVNAGIKTREEARSELGLAPEPGAKSGGFWKFNPYHDERGSFATAEGAVEPVRHENTERDRGIQVAENEFGPAISDAGFQLPTSASPTTDQPSIEPVRDIKNHQHETPTDAETLTAGDGQSFFAPPHANFSDVYVAGQTDGLLGANSNIGHFGRFDFQREGESFIDAYSNASNYAVGVYMAGAGYSLKEMLFIANTFAHTMSSNAGSQSQQAWWARGWKDATDKSGVFASSKIGH